MKIALVWTLPLLLLSGGCGLFLPPGEPPASLTGERQENRTITMAQAESSMCVSLTQFAVRKQIASVRLVMVSADGVNRRFLKSLDPHLFQQADDRNYEYILLSTRRGTTWTLSLKKKDAGEILWSRTIERIQN